MATRDVERKLTAVFVTDVAGYSRLMAENPDQTLETLTAYREVFSQYTGQFHGRIVNRPGDSILAEFGSVVDALTCAVEIQRELAERNLSLPENRRMQFRIGLTMGDVLLKEGEIYGNGVNIAARLEALADPGGICISRNVYDQVQARLPLHFEYLGEKIVKNIPEPVRAYKVLSEPGAAAQRTVEAGRIATVKWRKWRRSAITLAAGLMLILGIAAAGYFWFPGHPREEGAGGPPIPDKPSIAVLAFDNMSGDPAQEYFSDGISETIITRLARSDSMFVIARNSSFFYKGKAVPVQQIGKELGVRYLLEGSVQKSGDRIRVTAQLIEAENGRHLWADSYDREPKELFAVMDEITHRIVIELAVKLTSGEAARYYEHATENFEAYDLYLQGANNFFRFEKEANARGKKQLHRAIELDPQFARAMAILAWLYMNDSRYRWVKDTKAALRKSEEWARKALAIDDTVAPAYTVLSRIHTWKGQYEQAIAAGERAVEAEPGNWAAYHAYSLTMLYAGKHREALALIQKSMRLSPYHGIATLAVAGGVYLQLGRYAEAKPYFEKVLQRTQRGPLSSQAQRILISIDMELGLEEEARERARKFLEKYPETSLNRIRKRLMRAPFKNKDFIEPRLESLRRAGFPEK
ncbi:MAG: tetratricopeptide repeat protein [Candidatus Glassbacteria bacterium]|nr:tetratricopeptide repeat protein [Candidatus Glassbacteria bacterium]